MEGISHSRIISFSFTNRMSFVTACSSTSRFSPSCSSFTAACSTITGHRFLLEKRRFPSVSNSSSLSTTAPSLFMRSRNGLTSCWRCTIQHTSSIIVFFSFRLSRTKCLISGDSTRFWWIVCFLTVAIMSPHRNA